MQKHESKSLKRLARQAALLGASASALVLPGTALADVIDFSNTTGYGLDTDRVMVENIRYDATITNPFDPTRPTIQTISLNVPFRFDYSTLHLVPDLGTAVFIDNTTQCADLDVLVTDAVTGSVLSGALVQVGSSTAYTDSTGHATFSDLVSGTGQVSSTVQGYYSGDRQVSLSCNASNSVGLALNPSSGTSALSANQFRVVLTWGENPWDLDSHLTGPDAYSDGTSSDETNRFHVYYANEIADVANLDVDDVTSYGPETITVSPPSGATTLRPGLYRYSVHHYSGSSDISNSNAAVTLYLGSETRTFVPPAGAYGDDDVWTVFEILVNSSGTATIYTVNTFTNNVSSYSVRSTSTGMGAVETGIDFTRLPAK